MRGARRVRGSRFGRKRTIAAWCGEIRWKGVAESGLLRQAWPFLTGSGHRYSPPRSLGLRARRRIADPPSHRQVERSAAKLPLFPLVFGRAQFLDHFLHLRGAIRTKAGNHSIEQQYQRNDRNQVREKHARPPERAHKRSEQERRERPEEHQGKRGPRTPPDFKYADSLPRVYGVLKDGPRFVKREMME